MRRAIGRPPHGFRVVSMTLALGLFPMVSLAQPSADTPDASAEEFQPVTAARLEALQRLVSGEHPGVPIDSLLSVSLDDDSSMIERDKALRLERRRILIAMRVGERFKNKPEDELAQMRDQILGMELERKVLALPTEVRARLVELDGQGGQQAKAPERVAPKQTQAQAVDTKPAGAAKQIRVAQDKVTPAPAKAEAPAEAPPPKRGPSTGWATFFALLFGTLIAARLATAGLRWIGGRIVERRVQLEQLGTVSRFLIHLVGLTAAVILSLPLSHEVLLVILATFALTLAFAFKDFAASVLAGLIIVLQRPFQVGDRVDFGGIHGKVTEIGLSSVRLLTAQKRVITIPNNEFLTKLVSATQPSAAVTPLQVDFFIDPNQDLAAAKRIIEEAIQNTRSADAPKPRVILVNQVLIDRMVTVRLRTRVFVMGSQPEQEIESELTERVLEGFRTSGIRMPAVQQPAA